MTHHDKIFVYEAFRCEFGVLKRPDDETAKIVSEKKRGEKVEAPEECAIMADPKLILGNTSVLADKAKARGVLVLTIDLGAKVIRDKSVLDELVGKNRDPNSWNPTEVEKVSRCT